MKNQFTPIPQPAVSGNLLAEHKQFNASEANSTLRGLIKTLCNAISDFSDSEDGELVEDGSGFKRLCDAGERALICANSIPNPDAQAPDLLAQRDALAESIAAYREANREARTQLAAVIHQRDALKAALESCLEWMEFTIPRLKGNCPHCGKPVDAGGLNWGGPIHQARNALALAKAQP